MTNGNGSPPEGAPPQLNVLAQYTKDLSFENPNAPGSLAPQAQPPQINIQINVGANKVGDNDYEVTHHHRGQGRERRQDDVPASSWSMAACSACSTSRRSSCRRCS